MAWICPNCGREFRGKNQFHSCEQSTVEQHILNKPDFVVEIFHELLNIFSDFNNFEILPLKTTIQFRSKATFLSVYLKKNKVYLEFQLAYQFNFEQIVKSVRVSKNRIFYRVEIFSASDFNAEFIKILKDAYKLISE